MSVTYSIDAQGLREHSGRVAQCASGVHQGASAAATTIDGSAFGVMCSPLALPVGLVCGGAMIAIGHVAEELDALSRNLRTLEAAGLIEIAAVEGDLRRRAVWLTEAGARRLEAAIPAWRRAHAKLARHLEPGLVRRLAQQAEALQAAAD